MQRGNNRYAVYFLHCLLLAALCALAWRLMAQIPAVRGYFDTLYVRALAGGMIGEGHARALYLLLTCTLPGVLCAVGLMFGSRLLERRVWGSRALSASCRKQEPEVRKTKARLARFAGGAPIFLWWALRGRVVNDIAERAAIARLGLADPQRIVSAMGPNGEFLQMPAYLAHPGYDEAFLEAYPAIYLACESRVLFGYLAFLVLLDFGYRLYRRVRAERQPLRQDGG